MPVFFILPGLGRCHRRGTRTIAGQSTVTAVCLDGPWSGAFGLWKHVLCRERLPLAEPRVDAIDSSPLGTFPEAFPAHLSFGIPEPEDDMLMEGRRLDILQFVESHPGTHLRGIMRGLDLPMGVLQYHLNRLERGRAVVSRRRYLYKRYYRSLLFTEREQEVLDVLSQESEGSILLYLASNPGKTIGDVAQ